MAIALVVIAGAQAGLRAAAVARPAPRRTRARPLLLPAWLVTLQVLALGVFVMAAVIPAVSLARAVTSWSAFAGAVADARAELWLTVAVSVGAGVLAVPLGLAVASQLLRSGRSTVWWALVILPLATPASLVGMGLIAFWNQELTGAVYGSTLMLVLAGLARFAPIAALVLLAQLRRIDPLLVDAARLLQSSDRQTLTVILVPMLAPGVVAAFSITAVLVSGELGATLTRTAMPGHATLTMRVYNFLHYGAADQVAGLCLALTAAGLLSSLTAIWALSRNRGAIEEGRHDSA